MQGEFNAQGQIRFCPFDFLASIFGVQVVKAETSPETYAASSRTPSSWSFMPLILAAPDLMAARCTFLTTVTNIVFHLLAMLSRGFSMQIEYRVTKVRNGVPALTVTNPAQDIIISAMGANLRFGDVRLKTNKARTAAIPDRYLGCLCAGPFQGPRNDESELPKNNCGWRARFR